MSSRVQLICMDISKYACARNKNIAIEFIWTGWSLSGWRPTTINRARRARTRRREQQMHNPFAKLSASCICTLVLGHTYSTCVEVTGVYGLNGSSSVLRTFSTLTRHRSRATFEKNSIIGRPFLPLPPGPRGRSSVFLRIT